MENNDNNNTNTNKIWRPSSDTTDVKVEKDGKVLSNDEYFIQNGQVVIIKKGTDQTK